MPGLSRDDVREALRIAQESGFRTVSLRAGDDRFQAQLAPLPVAAAPAPAMAESVPSTPGQPAHLFIHAPAVGIFRPVEPAIRVGDTVQPDQLVGTVAALGLANDVLAKVAGEVVDVLVEPGQTVDYHRPLFRVNR